jgi:tetratricopeptide (TPR) repeat protein
MISVAMAEDQDKTGGSARSERTARFAQQPFPDVPPSKPLQWFLLVALIITGAAYVAGLWSQATGSQKKLAHQESKLRQMVQAQSGYLEHCKTGDDAFAGKHYDQAVSEYRLALQSQDNASGHEFLAQALLKQGNPDDAFAQFREALRMNPNLVSAASAWGLALTAQGKPDEAAHVFQQALQRNPDSALLHYNLADALLRERTDAEGRRRMAAAAGKTQEAQAAESEAKGLAADALEHFNKAGRNKLDTPAFWRDYGQLLNQLGQYADAESCLLRAASGDAGMAAAHFQLAIAEDHLGKYGEAIAHYEKVLTLLPDDPATLNNLALFYATATNLEVRTSKMAVQLAARACDATTGQNARYMDTLARAYAADGDFFQAITWEEKAIRRARQLNDEALAREFQARDALFMDHKSQ